MFIWWKSLWILVVMAFGDKRSFKLQMLINKCYDSKFGEKSEFRQGNIFRTCFIQKINIFNIKIL